MTVLQTNHDIIAYALFGAGEPQNNTSDFYDQALVELNRVYREICSGGAALDPEIDEVWWWLRSQNPGILTLEPALTGTAALTFNSTAGVLGAALPSSVTGYFLFLESDNGDVYRISAHTGGSANIILDGVYTGISGVYNYTIARLQYSLAGDVDEIIGPMRAFQNEDFNIDGVDLNRMLTDYPLRRMQIGIPDAFAMVGEQKVQFNRYPDVTARVEYDYLVRPGDLADDSNEPLIPLKYRSILGDYLRGMIEGQKSDTNQPNSLAFAKSGLDGMAAENRRKAIRMGSRFGRIVARMDQLSPWSRVPRSTSGYRFPR